MKKYPKTESSWNGLRAAHYCLPIYAPIAASFCPNPQFHIPPVRIANPLLERSQTLGAT